MGTHADRERHARIGRRRSSERGITVIELLLATSILAVMTGFTAGGLWFARRAFETDRSSALMFETNVAIQTISGVIGTALPMPSILESGKRAVVFDGRQESLSFVGLSEGRSLRGGPQVVSLRLSRGEVSVAFRDLTAESGGVPQDLSSANVVILRGVRKLNLAYFGKAGADTAAGWHLDWNRAELLPELVAVTVDFEDRRRSQPATIVALRQR
jgi:type II secretory pathway pseudopilin PulG